MNFKDIDEILDFAIKKEEEARVFYLDLAGRSPSGMMSKVFEDFSKEEEGHGRKLAEIKKGRLLLLPQKRIPDFKILELTEELMPSKEIGYREALLIAMKREKESYRLYSDLAGLSEDDGVRGALLMMAQEEARHKLRFEIEYDEGIFKEN